MELYKENSFFKKSALVQKSILPISGVPICTNTQLLITCSKLTVETLKQGVKYVQS